MVKKNLFFLLAGSLILTGWTTGCRKPANPVVPVNSAVLNLVIPSKILNSAPTAKVLKAISKDAVPDSSEGAFEYYLVADGEAPVTGVILFNSGSNVGNFFINLPKAGNWVVSGEWFYVYNPEDTLKKATSKLVLPGLNAIPEFVGADMVNVQGTTSFTLNMEDIGYDEYTCYSVNEYTQYLTDTTNCESILDEGYYYDLFSFNSYTFADTGSADVEALYDATTGSTYLSTPTVVTAGPPVTPPSIFTYLGNGDLVNFPVIPTGAVYYPTTLQAKAAVLGTAASTIAGGDIFVVKILSTNALAWVQFSAPNYDCTPYVPPVSSLLSFIFVYQNEGLNYMKFDQTTYGAANCNQNTAAVTTNPVGT